MSILLLVRNFVPAHEQIVAGDWNVSLVSLSDPSWQHELTA
jgi:formate dehydrogenase